MHVYVIRSKVVYQNIVNYYVPMYHHQSHVHIYLSYSYADEIPKSLWVRQVKLSLLSELRGPVRLRHRRAEATVAALHAMGICHATPTHVAPEGGTSGRSELRANAMGIDAYNRAMRRTK
jgi:hypothetical protein